MKLQRPVLTVLCASVLMVVGGTALAATHGRSATRSATESAQLANRYAVFAGSNANAEALVAGLQTGSSITLETPTTVKNANGTVSTVMVPNTFQPTTGKLGNGSVNTALALAREDLAKAGISNPTGSDIAAALNGGTVTPADGTAQPMAGVLALRAQGQGWGKVADTLGVKLGAVESASHNTHAQADTEHGHRGRDIASATGRPVHISHPTRVDHPQHPMVPDHPEVPQRPDIPSHSGRPGH